VLGFREIRLGEPRREEEIMRCSRLLVIGIVLLSGFICLASGAVAGTDEDVAAIEKVRGMEEASINEASADHVTMIYTEDVEYIPPGEPALKGVDAVRDWMLGLLEDFDGQLKYTASDITVVGQLAVEQYAGEVTLTPKAGGDPVVEQVRGIHIYRRGKDGSWKISHDIWNYMAEQ
jgi:ketosteroid isomerase-like protein